MGWLRRTWLERNPQPQPDRALWLVVGVCFFGLTAWRWNAPPQPGWWDYASFALAASMCVLAYRAWRRHSQRS